MLAEARNTRQIITDDFAQALRTVQVRQLTWMDFANLFLAMLGICCTLEVLYLWGNAEKKLARKLVELERLARL